jgi:hypothetical protein
VIGAALAIELLLSLGAGTASVRIAPGAQCVDAATLRRDLAAAGIVLRAGAMPRIDIRPQHDSLELEITYSPTQVLQRRVPVAVGECEAVKRLTVTLLTSWIETPPPLLQADLAKREPDASVRPSQSTERLTPEAAAPRPELVSPDQGTPEISVAVDAGPPPAVGTLEAGEVVPLLVTHEDVTVDGGEIVSQESRPWRFRVALLGGAVGGPASQAVGAGALQADVGGKHLAVGIEGGLETSQTMQVPPGAIAVSLQWVGLYARGRYLLGRFGLEGAIGLRGWRVAAAASGFTTVHAPTLFGAGPSLTAGATLHIVGPFAIVFRATGSLRLPEEHFQVDPAGTVMVLHIWELGALAGVEAEFL